jgi:hypothetical protein
MMRRLPQLCAILLFGLLLCAGCGDDDLDDHQIIPRTEPPTADAADVDASDAGDSGGDDTGDDPRCQGRSSGAVCELPNASGVCTEGRCQFLSCTAGFRNCDDDLETGCETDITDESSCGGCGVSCADSETCQLGRAGWLCSVSPVCPDEQYDLDGLLENACEWSLEGEDEGTFDPATIQPDAAVQLTSGTFAVAGSSSGERMVAAAGGAAAEPLPVPVDADDTLAARDVATAVDPADQPLVAVAWPDMLTLSKPEGSRDSDGVFSYGCSDAQDVIPREFIAVSGSAGPTLFAATTHEVLQIPIGSNCTDDAGSPQAHRQICDAPAAVFGASEYLQAYDLGDDSGECSGCLPDGSSCARLRPIGLQYLEDRDDLVVFTRRGFLVLEPTATGWNAGARFEFEAQNGARIVAGAARGGDDLSSVALLSVDGTLHRFSVDPSATQAGVRPAGPAVGLSASAGDESAGLVYGPEGVLMVNDDRGVWLVGPLDRSARIERLPRPDVFLGDQRVVFGTGSAQTPPQFSMLYFGLSRYYARHAVLR